MDAMATRMDALEDDAKKVRDDAKRKRKYDDTKRKGDDDDAADGELTIKHGDDDEPKSFAEQPTQGMAKEVVADSRADAQRKHEHALAEAQERADEACRSWGLAAKPAMMGESLLSYRKRLLRQHQRHSDEFGKIDLDAQPAGALFDAIERRIYADSVTASAHPDAPAGMLRMISKRMPSGHMENTFFGSPLTWMNQFAGASRRYVTKINHKLGES
jgi:hypothetical protein